MVIGMALALRRHFTVTRANKFRMCLQSFASTSDTRARPNDAETQTEGQQGDAATAFVDILRKGEEKPLSKMIRESKLCELGDVDGRIVIGQIVRKIHDDLYIDFGGKFEAVCKIPQFQSESFTKGAAVLLRLHDLELSETFLGAKRDLTLLEADATLLKLYKYDVATETDDPQEISVNFQRRRAEREQRNRDVIATGLKDTSNIRESISAAQQDSAINLELMADVNAHSVVSDSNNEPLPSAEDVREALIGMQNEGKLESKDQESLTEDKSEHQTAEKSEASGDVVDSDAKNEKDS